MANVSVSPPSTAPHSVTLSGEAEPLEEIARVLEQRQVFCRFLQVQYAFHSAQMDPVRDELLASLRGLQPRAATLPLFSTVSGRRIDGPEMEAEYWWRNVRQTVQFAAGVEHLLEWGGDTVVELSPHPVLTTSLAECSQHGGKKVQVMPSLRRREEERATMLRSLGRLYTLGYPLDWRGVSPGLAKTLSLPRYPWQHERFWSESEDSARHGLAAPAHPLLGASLPGPQPAWETRLDLRLTPYLNDHRVQGTVIFPATAYLEMAFAVAREVFGEDACRLEDVKLANPCFLTPDRPRRSACSLPCRRRDGAHPQPRPRWRRRLDRPCHHCFALLLHLKSQRRHSPRRRFARAVRSHSRETNAMPFAVRSAWNYGPLFQGIESGRRGEREALSEIRLPESLTAEDYLFHPALLDACFQSTIPAADDLHDANRQALSAGRNRANPSASPPRSSPVEPRPHSREDGTTT